MAFAVGVEVFPTTAATADLFAANAFVDGDVAVVVFVGVVVVALMGWDADLVMEVGCVSTGLRVVAADLFVIPVVDVARDIPVGWTTADFAALYPLVLGGSAGGGVEASWAGGV